jgi:CBS domain-containing protein
MIRKIPTISPDATNSELCELLLREGVSDVAVVTAGEGGTELVGVVSERECLEHLGNELFYDTPDPKVSLVMRRHPLCVTEDTDIFSLISIFTAHGFAMLPVVDGGELVGVVSRRAALEGLAEYRRKVGAQTDAVRNPPDLAKLSNMRFFVK